MTSEDPLLDSIRMTREEVKDRISRIVALHSELPHLQRALEELDWMLASQEEAPPPAKALPPEGLLNTLGAVRVYLTSYRIPDQDPNLKYALPSGTSSASSDYGRFVDDIDNRFSNEPEVNPWAAKVREAQEAFRTRQSRRQEATTRLQKLLPRLGQLHALSIQALDTAVAGGVSFVESAENSRELLVAFKGELLRRCPQGKGTKYERIADNLAFDNPLTRDAILSEQATYDILHDELTDIAKSKKLGTAPRMKRLVSLLEDHVLIITTASDPDKLGVAF